MSHTDGTGDDFRERAIPTVPKPRATQENTGAKGRIPRQADRDQRDS